MIDECQTQMNALANASPELQLLLASVPAWGHVMVPGVPQQGNDNDCGVYVAVFMKCLALGLNCVLDPAICALPDVHTSALERSEHTQAVMTFRYCISQELLDAIPPGSKKRKMPQDDALHDANTGPKMMPFMMQMVAVPHASPPKRFMAASPHLPRWLHDMVAPHVPRVLGNQEHGIVLRNLEAPRMPLLRICGVAPTADPAAGNPAKQLPMLPETISLSSDDDESDEDDYSLEPDYKCLFRKSPMLVLSGVQLPKKLSKRTPWAYCTSQFKSTKVKAADILELLNWLATQEMVPSSAVQHPLTSICRFIVRYTALLG